MTDTMTGTQFVPMPGEYDAEPILTTWEHDPLWPSEGVIVRRRSDGTVFLYHGNALYQALPTSEREHEPRWALGPDHGVHQGPRIPVASVGPTEFTLTRYRRYTMSASGPWPEPDLPDEDVLRAQVEALRRDLADGAPEQRVDDEARSVMPEVSQRLNETSVEEGMCPVYDRVIEQANGALLPPLQLEPRHRLAKVRVPVQVTVRGTTTVWVEVEVQTDSNGDWTRQDVRDAVDEIDIDDHDDGDYSDVDLEPDYDDVYVDTYDAEIVED